MKIDKLFGLMIEKNNARSTRLAILDINNTIRDVRNNLLMVFDGSIL